MDGLMEQLSAVVPLNTITNYPQKSQTRDPHSTSCRYLVKPAITLVGSGDIGTAERMGRLPLAPGYKVPK